MQLWLIDEPVCSKRQCANHEYFKIFLTLDKTKTDKNKLLCETATRRPALIPCNNNNITNRRYTTIFE